MQFRLGSFFQKNAHSLPRRLYFAILRRLFGVFSKRQAVYFVDINGKRFKRVVLGDAFEASLVESALLAAPAGARFPPLIQRHENELLLGFVEGRRFNGEKTSDRNALADFLGALYSVGHDCVAPDRLQRALETDLEFLVDVGRVHRALGEALLALAEQLRPAEIRTGLDYVDPVEKNFIIHGDALHAIDVESLQQHTPLATGIAKAGIHWLERDDTPAFVARVEQAAGISLTTQLPYIELCFRAAWIKRKLLQGKHRSIRIDFLHELVEQDVPGPPMP